MQTTCGPVDRTFVTAYAVIPILIITLRTDLFQSDSLSEIPAWQNLLMVKALNHFALAQIRGDASESADVCTWRQIECTDGIVTSMWASREAAQSGRPNEIMIPWLPPTMRCIHLHSTRVSRLWQNPCLPRDLRYLFLEFCDDVESSVEQIDFSFLPMRMQEFILIDSNVHAVIRLDGLPETMRFVYLRQYHTFVHGIIVDYKNLPRGLEGLYASIYGGKGSKIKETGKMKGVKLVKDFGSTILRARSNFYQTFEKRCAYLE